MNLLEMNHVKKSFGDLKVIQDISMHGIYGIGLQCKQQV